MRLIDADVLIEILTTAIMGMKGMAKLLNAEDDPEIKMEIKAYTDILNGVKEQPTIEPDLKWIPCSVRLPEEEGEYLVSFDDGFIATTGYYEGDFELWADAGEPLAWMPLPEGYREEK